MDSEPTKQQATYICERCGARRFVPGTGYGTEICPKCKTRMADELFEKICPAAYRETDVAQLPKNQFDRAMQWTMGPRGLLLMGPTGQCKTRIAWKVIERLVRQEYLRSIAVFSGVSFGHELAKAYKRDEAEEWLERIWEAKVVFFDDLGKLKLTERAETELFGVIDHRTSHNLPIITTTNDTGDTIADRMSDNRGPALVRRLREFCQVITFP